MYPNMCPLMGMSPMPMGCYYMLPGMPTMPRPMFQMDMDDDDKRLSLENEGAEDEGLKEDDTRVQPSGFPGPGYGPGHIPPGQIPGHIPGQFPGNVINTPAEILRFIEVNEPQIIRTMQSYGMPLPVARRITREIIRTSLRFCRPGMY